MLNSVKGTGNYFANLQKEETFQGPYALYASRNVSLKIYAQ